MSERFEIVVIGGGAVGASILWHLAAAGRNDSVLIEKHELTAGSTWHAAGNVPTFANSWLGQRAGNYAWQLYAELADDPDHPITYRRTQAFWPGHTPERIDHFHHVVGIAAGLGLDLQLVSPAEMEAMHPYWHDDNSVIAGILDPYEGDIDPAGLTQAMARRARALGAEVRRQSRVVAIDRLDGTTSPPSRSAGAASCSGSAASSFRPSQAPSPRSRVDGAGFADPGLSDGGPQGSVPGRGIRRRSDARWRVHVQAGGDAYAIDCDIVIDAAGFYGAEVAALAGIDVPLAVLEHQYLLTAPLPDLTASAELFPLVRDPEIMFYLRRENDRLLFGSYGHEGRTAWADGLPDAFDSSLFAPDHDGIAEVAEKAMSHLPILREAGVAEFVNGPIAYSPDMSPLIGPAAGVDGFYLAVGVQVGITHAAAAGKVLAELITEGDTEWDVWGWDPRRFGDWATAGSGSGSYANSRARELYEHQYAAPFPHRQWTSARPLRQSPLYPVLAAKGARFGQIAGWERALWFGAGPYSHTALSYRDEHWHAAVAAECEAVRDRVGVMDHCGFSRFEVSGPDAATFLDRVFCSRLPEVGRVRLAYMLRPNGTVFSEATIARLADDRFWLLGPTVTRERDFDWLRHHLSAWRLADGASLRHGTARSATLMVMGPQSRTLLSRLTDADLSKEAAPWMSVREIEIAGVAATALRVSFVGELGWELHVAEADLVGLYGSLCDVGADLGVGDFGSYALDSMRIEKGYHGFGTEFGVEYTPFDAGLQRFVAIDPGPGHDQGAVSDDKGDFVGRRAVSEAAGRPADWSYGIFTVDTSGIEGPAGNPPPSAPIRIAGEAVGFVTSAAMGFRSGLRVCLGYVQGRHDQTDHGFTIDAYGTNCPALRHRRAVYDPDNLRPRS